MDSTGVRRRWLDEAEIARLMAACVRTSYTAALEDAKIHDATFHTLRHTFASHYMMRGGNLYDLKEILGHRDIKLTAATAT